MVTKKKFNKKLKTYATMRKMLFAIFAMGALVSCLNEEILDLSRERIAFGEVFVDNGTRADYSSDDVVPSFKVYGTATGTYKNTVQIFNGADVTRNGKADGEAWDCDKVQYWLPNTVYNFVAIVDGQATTTTLPATIDHVVADGDANKDLLYATATVTTDENATPSGVNSNDVVAFNFNHLLSQMQFKITNETNQVLKVTNITVTGFAKEGTYTINGSWGQDGKYTVSGGTWAQKGSDKIDLTFGTATVAGDDTVAASETRQILPLQQTLNVSIIYKFGDDGEEMEKTGTINQAFAQNTVYVVTASISGTAIDFSLGTVTGWGDPDGTITI